MRPVRQGAVHSLWSRLFCGPLKMRRVPQEPCFWHRISIPYRRSLFFTPNASENASRTTEACFLHRAHIPYQRRPSPVPNFSNCQKKESIACTEYNKCQKGRGPFLYGALLETRRVPEEAFFDTECLWPLYQRSGAVTPIGYNSGIAGKRKRTNRHF